MCTSMILTNLCLTKQNKKKYICKYFLQCFNREKFLVEHKEISLKINGKQTVKLKRGLIKFKIYSRQTPAPFKVCTDFK